jgi:hypothetical protein
VLLLESAGRWKPQLYLSLSMLELWPEKHLQMLVLHERVKIKGRRSLFAYRPAKKVETAGIVTIFPFLVAYYGWPWYSVFLATMVVLLIRYCVDFLLRAARRSDTALADRGSSKVLGNNEAAQAIYTQAVIMYEYHQHLATLRRKRLLERLEFVFYDAATAGSWVDSYEEHQRAEEASLRAASGAG